MNLIKMEYAVRNISDTGRFLAFILLLITMLILSGCEKDNNTTPDPVETGYVSDIDGNVYVTVKIGEQWWMAQDLKVTRYRDGNPVTLAQTAGSWNTTDGAYCLYDNNDNAPGFLYNGYAVTNASNLAPEGWHIPTDEEWKQLEAYLGMNDAELNSSGWRGSTEGLKLKKEGVQGWAQYEELWPTNESGFNALAGSCRLFNANFGTPGLFYTGFWWTKSSKDSDNLWYRHLDYKNADVFRYYGLLSNGYSIRCVKD